LAFFRAFIDDSATEDSDRKDRRLFFAGYLNRAENWALFAEAWAEELAAPPAIAHLHMVEAQNLRDQFKGWTESAKNEKLRGLARVIRHFEPLSFEMSLNRDHFYEVLKPVSPRGLANPHFSCCGATVATVAKFAAAAKLQGQIEFIFDEQDGVDENIDLFFDQIKPWLPRKVQKMIAGRPLFRSDLQFTPLQAADMLVWHLRREHEVGDQLSMADLLRGVRGHLVSQIDEETITAWAHHDQQIPGIKLLKTKSQWRSFKAEFTRLAAAGISPHKIGRPTLLRRIWNRIWRYFVDRRF
jgi:hypothetical protein